jgi:hypothetical protein
VRRRAEDKDKTERQLLSEISAKLDRVAALIAIQNKEPAAQIRVLSKMGIPSGDIGALLDRSPATIRWSRTTRMKRAKAGAKRRTGS